MCDGGVCSILLLPLVARCLETIDVCILRMIVFISVVVTKWGFVGKFVVYFRPFLKIFLALECCLRDGMLYILFVLWGCRSSCMGSVSVVV